MTKIITNYQTIELKNTCNLYPKDISANDIRIEGYQCINLFNLNFNIAKYDIDDHGARVYILNSNINKLVLNGNRRFIIRNSTINDIYIQSEIREFTFINTNIPNLHGRVDLINKIRVTQ